MVMYGYVGLCMRMYGYVSLGRVFYGYVCLCRVMHGDVWLCMAIERLGAIPVFNARGNVWCNVCGVSLPSGESFSG